MKLLDLNLLLYAVDATSARHERAKAFLEEALRDEELIALPWVVITGFVRVSTNPRVFREPLTSEQATGFIDAMLARPNVVPVDPGTDHWRTLRSLLREHGATGNLVTDAHLATLAIERGAELCSADADFRRFATLRWRNPLAD